MSLPALDRRFCVAPMMDCTDRHCRYFMRLLSKHAVMYSEMVTTGALLHGDKQRFLRFDASEQPIALQLGGSDPKALAACAALAEQWGYDEVNLNVGCPSDRVKSGQFGACLMAQPELVGECVAAMQARVQIPVTVKNRIGIDRTDSIEALYHFTDVVAQAGCEVFIVHARKAWLDGLSPRQNRDIPPLRYDVVHQLKRERPDLEIIINGGLKTIAECQVQLQHVDGVMLGREPYHSPWLLAEVDQHIYGSDWAPLNRQTVVEQMLPYIEAELAEGNRFSRVARHMVGLFLGQPRGRVWRRFLSEQGNKRDATAAVLTDALQLVLEGDEQQASA